MIEEIYNKVIEWRDEAYASYEKYQAIIRCGNPHPLALTYYEEYLTYKRLLEFIDQIKSN